MKRIALLILAAVVIFGLLLTLNGDVSAKKRKGKKTPNAGQAAQQMAQSRNVATVPNFTPAAGDYIIPNSDTVSTNFVLQGDTTGGGVWATIPVTEYEIDPKAGYIVQRVTDLVTGTGVDWSIYSAYRLSAYTKSVSGARTAYTNQSVTFAETDTGYSPIGQVGDINGAMLKNAFVNFLVAAGAAVVIDDSGITIVSGSGAANNITWIDSTTFAVAARLSGDSGNTSLTANASSAADTGINDLAANDSNPNVSHLTNTSDATDGQYQNAYSSNAATYKGIAINTADAPVISDGAGIDLNGKIIRIRTSKTPSSASDTGNAGEIAWDSSYIYICIASNTWRRIAHSTW